MVSIDSDYPIEEGEIRPTRPQISAADFTLRKVAENAGFVINDKYYIRISTSELAANGIAFEELSLNRTVDIKVVKERVNQNLEKYQIKGEHMDFGEIKLCAIIGELCPLLYLTDGQHRIRTMMELYSEHNMNINFVAVIKLVKNISEIREYFEHINKCRPIDPETIFNDIDDKRIVEEVSNWIDKKYTADVIKPERECQASRPYLCQRAICHIYRALKTKVNHDMSFEMKRDRTFQILEYLNDIIKNMSTDVSMNGLKNHSKVKDCCDNKLKGCYLGLLRKDHMSWRVFDQLN